MFFDPRQADHVPDAQGKGKFICPTRLCMQIDVQWRSLSDVRARDGRDQGHSSRKLREPGVLGTSLLCAATAGTTHQVNSLVHFYKKF